MSRNQDKELINSGADKICKTVQGSEPFCIGRNGTIETEVLFFWTIHRSRGGTSPITLKPYPESMKDRLERHAGIFPPTEDAIDAWCRDYVETFRCLRGGAAGWYAPLRDIEDALLNTHAPGAFRCPLRSLEPYYVTPDLQWTRFLAGKRVTVVSSFTESMERQIQTGAAAAAWTGLNRGLLPDCSWSFVRTFYAPATALGKAAWPGPIQSTSEALAWTVERVRTTSPDIVLIGCGGMGMPLAGRLHALGISSIVLGGAIQVLFGIKGSRWESHAVISRFWNSSWTWPSSPETPGGAGRIEGFCYWRGGGDGMV